MKITLTPLGMGLFLIGTLFMAIGLYSMSPLRLNRAFWIQNGPLMLMLAIGLYYIVRARVGPDFISWVKPVAKELCQGAVMRSSQFLILMILLVLVMSVGSIVIKMYKDPILAFSKAHHIAGAFIASLLSPTSNSMIPIIEGLWEDLTMRPMCLYYLQASALMSFPLFRLRQMGFTSDELSWKMYISGCIVALCMLPLAVPIHKATNAIYDFTLKKPPLMASVAR